MLIGTGLHSVYQQDNGKTNNEVSRTCRTHREKKNKYRIFVGNLEGKSRIGRPGRRWVKIKIYVGRWTEFILQRADDGLL
jgi:hypothetical protein